MDTGCLHLVAVVNSSAVNMDVQTSPRDTGFLSFVFIPRSGIAGSCHSSSSKFLRRMEFLRGKFGEIIVLLIK